MSKAVYLVAAKRTPIGSFLGALSSVPATRLGATALKAALEQAGLQPGQIEDLYFGNVLGANLGQAPATQVALYAGLPDTTPTTVVNKVCASGTKTIMLGSQAIQLGHANLVAAGGMENMSLAPHYVTSHRQGHKYGNQELLDAIVRDGLQDVYSGMMMGMAGEMCVEKFGFTRQGQDDFTERSYRLAQENGKNGKYAKEIVPVVISGPKGDITVDIDEEPAKVNFEKMRILKPAFKKDGTITAANAPGINDGAAAVILASEEAVKANNLKPIARIAGYADAARHPEWFTLAPIDAVPLAAKRAGISMSDIDLFEINEAFSCVPMAFYTELGIDPSKVNVRGGAVALGHPIGMSGTRIVISLANGLIEEGKKYGAVGICNGGGGASALILERV